MSNIKFTNKMLDAVSVALKLQVNLLTFEGTVRSSKTVTAVQAFFYRVIQSDGFLHLIAGRDFDTIKNNVLEADGLGLLPQFEPYCKLDKDKIGSYYVKVTVGRINKKIMLVNYSNISQWKKVLGSSIECVFVDEVNIADKQFVDECFSRQVSFDHPFTIFTLNGDIPTHWCYTDYINTSTIIGNAPASIIADMAKVEKVKGRYYMHWTFEDNPVMTPEKIARAKALYPIGSYYYTIKILGERGAPGELIFLDYLTDDIVQHFEYTDFDIYTVGIDIGATRAKNSVSLIGFKRDFSAAAIMDCVPFSLCGYKEKTERIKSIVDGWKEHGIYIEGVFIDSAEQNYITDMKTAFNAEHLPPVAGSYKATIKARIDLLIILFSLKRLKFNDNAGGKRALQAYKIAKWAEDKKGEEREDNNEPQNDIMDSVEYAITRHMNALLKAATERK